MSNAKNFFFLAGNVADRVDVEFRSFDDKMLLTFTDSTDIYKDSKMEVTIRTETVQTVNGVYRDNFIAYTLTHLNRQIVQGESQALSQGKVIAALIAIVNDYFPIDTAQQSA
ncbi:hypothetical protein Hena1_02570 [Erwinia phage Hena1]|uniref:Uncharacterized protein n=1 Tax=Erwinia phage Hena1 TaxID=2678601 RepID=A0A6B9JIL0_9CAUD|nr:hypothetical protein HWC84_gp107 [Erwinia phage Hena1]QGZ16407.1 hypothetical protein Hena1_02570 [Erwinia phage Hena1]